MSPRKNDKARFPGAPIERYLNFHDEEDREQYQGRAKIPMETFHEKYFDGGVDFNGDALEIMEYRHDWASFRFTWGPVQVLRDGDDSGDDYAFSFSRYLAPQNPPSHHRDD